MPIKFIFNKSMLGLNSPFANMLFLATATDAKRYTNPLNSAEFIIESTSDEYFSVPDIKSLIDAGVVVQNLPLFIMLNATEYNAQVPEYLAPNSTIWADWKTENHEHIPLENGDVIIPGNAMGVELASSQIQALIEDNYSLFKGSEVQLLLGQVAA